MVKSILFVCTHNSARSQIAEGLVNYKYKSFKAFSAGTEKTKVHPLAIQVMKEIKIDISDHKSKHIDEFMDRSFDIVVTVCDNAMETCPYFPNTKKRIHAGFDDPSSIEGDKSDKIKAFRNTRDSIDNWLEDNLSDL